MTRPALATLACLALPLPAAADITPEDLWAAQTGWMEAIGLGVSAFEVRNGDTLVISDIDIELRLPMDFGEITFRSGPLRYRETGDGRVEGDWDEVTPINFFAILGPQSDVTVTGSLSVRQTDRSMIASGTPDDITTESGAGLTELSLTALDVSGEDMPGAVDAVFGIAVADATATNRLKRTDSGWEVESTSRNGPTRYEFAFDDPLSGMGTTATGTTASAEANGRITLPDGGIDLLNLSAALRRGLSFSGSSTVTDQRTQTLTVSPYMGNDQQVRETALAEASFGFDADGFRVESRAEGTSGSMTVPLYTDTPLGFDVATAAISFDMPLLAGRGPSGARLAFTLDETTIRDEVWDLVDPEARLPRGPASLSLDMSATVEPLVDLLDFEALTALIDKGEPPVEVTTFDLDGFSLAALGAGANATGSFTLDPEDTETIPGLPRPEGTGSLTLTGINGVLDRLVDEGFIPPGEASGFRLGLGMFTDVAAPDELTSTLTIDGAGKVFVNGQRMR